MDAGWEGRVRRTWSAEKEGVYQLRRVPGHLSPCSHLWVEGQLSFGWIGSSLRVGVQSWPKFSGARKERGWESMAAQGRPSQNHLSQNLQAPVKADGSFHPRLTGWAVL